MNMPTNKPSLKEKLYQETMFHEGDPEQSVFPDAVSMDTANQRIKLAIEKTEAEAKSDTAKQIFKKLDKSECSSIKDQVKHSKRYHAGSGFQAIHICIKDYEALKKKYNIED